MLILPNNDGFNFIGTYTTRIMYIPAKIDCQKFPMKFIGEISRNSNERLYESMRGLLQKNTPNGLVFQIIVSTIFNKTEKRTI